MNLQQPSTSSPPTEYEQYEDEIRRYKPDSSSESSGVPISPQARENIKQIPPEKAYKKASGSFYAIAGFSFINSLISIFGGGLVFVIGLGITQFIDAIAHLLKQDAGDSGFIFLVIALVFDVGACLTFVLFGYFTSRGKNWSITIGMILYSLDAILVLLFKDWIGFAFHLYFLWQIWMMYSVLGYWKKLKKKSVDSFPQDIGVS